MMIIGILLTSAVCVFAVPRGAPSLRIVGGDDAERGEFPYSASYQQNDRDDVWSHACGGTIIADTWVLTAANCITSTNLDIFRIVAGILMLSDGEDVETKQILPIQRQIVHELYDGNVGPNDIALVEVKTPFTWNDAVQPVPLPPPDFVVTGDAVLSGWGNTNFGMPNTLQKASIPIVENAECKAALDEKLDDNPFDDEANVCTGPLEGGIAACISDAGDALVQEGVVVGLVSWGMIPCGQAGVPTVYTKVTHYLDWINEKVDS